MIPKINIDTKQNPGWKVKRGGEGPNGYFELANKIGESMDSEVGVSFNFLKAGPHFPT